MLPILLELFWYKYHFVLCFNSVVTNIMLQSKRTTISSANVKEAGCIFRWRAQGEEPGNEARRCVCLVDLRGRCRPVGHFHHYCP